MQTAATVTMRASELERLHWMRALAERRVTQREVAGHLGLGVRQSGEPSAGSASEQRIARQLRGLLEPAPEELLVELFVLVDVQVAGVWVLGLDRRHGAQRGTAQKCHLHVLG